MSRQTVLAVSAATCQRRSKVSSGRPKPCLCPVSSIKRSTVSLGGRRSHRSTGPASLRCKAHGRHGRRVTLQSHPDALPAECCDGRHPQRRESRSEIAGGIISGSQIRVTGKRVTTFERPPRGGLSFCADLGVCEIALACKALDLNDFRSPGTF